MHHTPQKLLVCCPEVCTLMCHTRINLITAGKTPVAQPFCPVICVLGLVLGCLSVGHGRAVKGQPGGAVKGQPGYSYAPLSTPHSGLSAVCIFSSEGEREHVLGSCVSSRTQAPQRQEPLNCTLRNNSESSRPPHRLPPFLQPLPSRSGPTVWMLFQT